MKIGPINIWFDWVPIFTLKMIPRVSFFNGGKYWKFSIYWLRYLLEFSGPKKNKKVYKEITSEELDSLLQGTVSSEELDKIHQNLKNKY